MVLRRIQGHDTKHLQYRQKLRVLQDCRTPHVSSHAMAWQSKATRGKVRQGMAQFCGLRTVAHAQID